MNDRAVSTTISYTLTLTIATLLVTGLVVAGSDFVENRQTEVVREELSVIGQQVASDLAQADRLVRAADSTDPTVEITRTYPKRVAGGSYQITLDQSEETVELESVSPDVTVTVNIDTVTTYADSSVDGGRVRVVYNSGGSQLEVQND
jgi:hypothetical protein